jgi:hypothetical protein
MLLTVSADRRSAASPTVLADHPETSEDKGATPVDYDAAKARAPRAPCPAHSTKKTVPALGESAICRNSEWLVMPEPTDHSACRR